MRSLLAAILLAIICLPAAGQVSAKLSQVKAITGATNPQIVNNLVLVDGDSSPVVANVAKIVVDTTAERVNVKGSVVNGYPIEVIAVDRTTFLVPTPGTHWIDISYIQEDPIALFDETVQVVVGDSPGPSPGPDPPGPSPDVPAPIDLPGLRVLIVYESADTTKLTPGQNATMRSKKMADFLNANCVEDGWRVLDQDAKFTNPDHHWAKALKRDRVSLPWLIVSNGTTGFEGPLTNSVEETIALIERYKVAK